MRPEAIAREAVGHELHDPSEDKHDLHLRAQDDDRRIVNGV